jgi:hypothetical protein
VKVFENTEVIKVDLGRRGFTKHGQHMKQREKNCYKKE